MEKGSRPLYRIELGNTVITSTSKFKFFAKAVEKASKSRIPSIRCARVFLDPGDGEMSRENDPVRLQDPWRFIAVAVASASIVVVFGLGFLLLPRYQAMHAPSSPKDSVYHALGFHTHGNAFNTVQPPLKVPTYIAWTETTIRQAANGDPKRGQVIAQDCAACHGEKGLSTQSGIPSLAGLDRLVLYKQLEDFRSGTRLSTLMSAIVQSLTPQQYADLAAYFESLPGLPENRGERSPRRHSSYHNGDPVQRLIYAGDPKRGIAACAACHGPGGYRIGAPALTKQNELYIEQQLQAFAQGTRANDMNMPMRTISAMLTESEMKALAHVYASENIAAATKVGSPPEQ
jgi:cytochrome c553